MKFITVLFTLLVASNTTLAQDTWRGLIIAPENRCSPYDKKSQYPYPQSVEDIVVANMGGIVYGPYTGRIFENDRKTDIEHILSTSEGHDSGLCAASPEVRKQFAIDPLNLTLAAPEVNRCNPGGKCGFDAAEWMPEKNQCWFSNRIVEIRQKYKLTIDNEKIKITAKDIILKANIKSVGEFSAEVILHPEVTKEIKVSVKSNSESAIK